MTGSQRTNSLKRALYGLVILGSALAAVWILNPLILENTIAVPSVITLAGLRDTTDRRIEILQELLEERPSDSSGYLQLGNAYLQKARETGDLSYHRSPHMFMP